MGRIVVELSEAQTQLLYALATEDRRTDLASEIAWLIEKESAQRERRRRINELLDGEE